MKFGERDYFDIACFSYMAKTQKYDLKLADLSFFMFLYADLKILYIYIDQLITLRF